MNSRYTSFRVSLLILLPLALLLISGISPLRAGVDPEQDVKTQTRMALQKGMSFIENKGQIADPAQRWYTRAGDVHAYFSESGVTFVSLKAQYTESPRSVGDREITGGSLARWDLRFEGAQAHPRIEVLDREETQVRWYTEAGQGQSDLYRRLVYRDLYPGIDLVYYITDSGLKYDLVVKPGARLSDVRLRYDGIESLTTNEDGAMVVHTPFTRLIEQAPVTYQVVDGRRVEVPSRYVVNGTSFGFSVETMDESRELIVDPGLVWSTYFGGANLDYAMDVAQDGNGNLYMTGYTVSTNIPGTPGVFQVTNGGLQDAFVAKFNSGGGFLWFTYFGGGANDNGASIAIDGAGNVVVAGRTESVAFPTSGAVLQPTLAGGSDGFVFKLDPSGARLWCTYLGGNLEDYCAGVVVYPDNQIGVTGWTSSNNFPTATPFQASHQGLFDIFVTRLTANGQGLVWSTYFGGTDDDLGASITCDGAGATYITGQSRSGSLPIFPTGQVKPGGVDVITAKFSPTGQRDWCVYWGGPLTDAGSGIALDAAGNVATVGYAFSSNHVGPTFQSSNNGGSDAFMAKYNPANGQLLWNTYYGGTMDDYASGVAPDGKGGLVIVGRTASHDFPITPNALQVTKSVGNDAFAVKFKGTGQRDWATFFGGNSEDQATSGVVDLTGNLIMAGWTASASLPVQFAYQPTNNGATDAFLAKLCDIDPIVAVIGANPLCQGDTTVLDAGPGYSFYFWNTGETTRTIRVTTTGYYKVTVTSGTNCIKTSDSVLVLVNPRPIADAGPNLSVCSGIGMQLQGSATLGTLPYRFQWTPTSGLSQTDVATPVATVVNPNPVALQRWYYLRVTDANGCFRVDSTMLTVHPGIQVNAGADVLLCPGYGATIGNPATGGTGALSYQWLPTTALANPIAAQTLAQPRTTTSYVVTVTDGLGCTGKDTVVVTRNTLAINAGRDRAICSPSSVTIGGIASGGRPPYVYSWAPAASLNSASIAQPTATPATTTNYVVTVTDADNCVVVDTVRVSVYTSFQALAGKDVEICYGSSTVLGDTVVCGSSNLTYLWSPATNLSNQHMLHPIANPLATTQYILTVTDNVSSLVSKDTIVVIVNAPPVADPGPNKTICLGSSTSIGLAPGGGNPPYNYTWTPAQGLSGTDISSPTASPSATTTYTLVLTDAKGCTDSKQVSVSVLPKPTAVAGPDKNVCAGNGVQIGGTATGGTAPYMYLWTPPATLNSSSIATPVATPAADTRYMVLVTDANNCQSRDTVDVSVRGYPAITMQNAHTICWGSSVQIGGAVTGGQPPYVYQWSPTTGLNNASAAQPTAKPTATTTYTLLVTDAFGCTATASVTITVKPSPIANAGPDRAVCQGDTVSIGNLATGGVPPYFYRWSPSLFLSDSTVARTVARPLFTTSYTLQVFDQQGCSTKDTVVVTVNTTRIPAVSVLGPTVFCNGGTTTLVAETGYARYLWSNGDTNRAAVIRSSGSYVVVATDPNGCAKSSPPVDVTVHIPIKPRIAVNGPTTFCRGLSVKLDIIKMLDRDTSWTYWWSTGDTGRSLTVSEPGLYWAFVRDDKGCVDSSAAVTITVVDQPSPMITANGPLEFCIGGRVTLDAGDGYASYLWSTGARTRTLMVTSPGDYWVKVWNSAGCESTSASVTVRVGPEMLPEVTASGRTDLCYEGSVNLTANFGFVSYQWSNGNRSRVITVTEPGNFWVTVTDDIGCTAKSRTVVVTKRPQLVPAVLADRPANGGYIKICQGDSVTLRTAEPFVSYKWSTGAETPTIKVSFADRFGVAVVDTQGCTGVSLPVIVSTVPRPVVNLTAEGPTTFCEEQSVVLDAGAGHTRYEWSTGESTQKVIITKAGRYTVTVYNQDNCATTSSSVDVTVNPQPKPVVTALGPTTFCEGDSVRLDAGANYASYSWSNGATSRLISVKRTDLYLVRVTDRNGCRGESPFVSVTVNPRPAKPVISKSGNVLISSPAISYQWYFNGTAIPGAINQAYTAFASGTYYVKIKDIYGCDNTSDILNVVVTAVDAPFAPMSLNLYPDPNPGRFSIDVELAQPERIDLRITNVLGQTVYSESNALPTQSWHHEVNLSTQPSGQYFIHIQAGDQSFVRRVRVQ